MKALRINGLHSIEVINTEKPAVKPGYVLIKVNYVGFCGSDLNTWRGMNAMAKMPVIPGHEVGAVVEEVGECVPSEIKPGMVCTINPYTNCGHCAACRDGRYNACENNETLGVQRDGAMREYVLLPWNKIIPAEGISLRDCALIEPMSVGFHAVSRAQVEDNNVVMVIGCGMVGLGAIVRAATRGAIVIAADIDDEKLQQSLTVGATYTINTLTEDVHARLQKITHGLGPDVVIEAVGSPVTYQTATNEIGFTGRVVCIGYSKKEVSFQTSLFVKKELDIRGSRNATPSDFRAVIAVIRSNKFNIEQFISKVVKPEEAAKAMEEWNSNPGKVFRILVDFTNSSK
jgi:threonine dehydrogenase-like Zn-dependent dehydrogenase